VHRMFFLDRNFASGFLCAPQPPPPPRNRKNLTTLKIFKNLITFSKKRVFQLWFNLFFSRGLTLAGPSSLKVRGLTFKATDSSRP